MKRRAAKIALTVALSVACAGAGALVYADTSASADTTASVTAAQADAQGFIIEDGVLTGYTGTATDIVIPDGVTEIAARAFDGQRSIDSVAFSDSVRKIGSYAFRETGIKQVTLPAHLEEIGHSVFYGCDLDAFEVTSGLYRAVYGNAEGVTDTWIDSPFDGCSIKSVTFDESVSRVAENLFRSAGKLESVVIPKSITSVDQSAFDSCSLGSVSFADNVTTIGTFAFAGTDLEEIALPDSLTFIGYGAFSGCEELQSIDIPDSVMTLGVNAFSDCTSLKTAHIPASLEGLDGSPVTGAMLQAGTFWGCGALKDVTFGEGIKILPEALFASCGLEKIEVPATVETIERYVFSSDFIGEVSIPASVTSINDYAFFFAGDNLFIHCEPGSYAEQFAQHNRIPYTSDLNHEHSWGPWEVAWEATCTSPKTEKSTCPVCGAVREREVGEALGHDFSGEWNVDREPTCTEPGQGSRHCARCDEVSDKMEIPALGHAYSDEWTVDKEAACTEAGEKSHHCTREGCDARTDVTEIPALGHDFSGDWVIDKAATCTEPGERVKYCNRCGERGEVEAIPALGHDFGAWVEDAPATYFSEGARHRICSRCDAREDAIIPKLTPDFDAHPDYTFAKLHVVDAQSLESIDSATVTVTNDQGDVYTLITEQGGQAALFVPAGTYYLTIENDGYQPRGFEYTFDTGTVNLPDIGISTESLVQGELTVEEMTQDEIIDAGIDTGNPDNQHVFKYEVTLVFSDGIEQYTVPSITYKNSKGEVVGGTFGNAEIKPGEPTKFVDHERHTSFVRVNEYLYIVIQGEAKWQKEMFHAQLVVVNATQTDTMENVTATLNLPDGLSFAHMVHGTQDASQSLGTVATGGTKTVDWYIRGDEQGDYNLEAALTGSFEPLGTPFEYTFKTDEPLHVYAGSDMKMTVHISDAAYYGEPYTMIFELENVSDHDIYNVRHEIQNIAQYQVVKKAWVEDGEEIKTETDFNLLDSEVVGEDGVIEREVFHPGEKLSVLVKTDIAWVSPLMRLKDGVSDFNTMLKLVSTLLPVTRPVSSALSLVNYIDVRYYLTDTIVQTLEGSTAQIPVEFDVEHHAGVKLSDKLAEEIIKKFYGKGSSNTLKLMLGEDGKAWYDLASSIFKGGKTVVDAEPLDPDTEYFAWVEDADGSNVIQISAGGAETDDEGRLVLKGSTEISVDALNTGSAYLVVVDSDGNVTKKQFTVEEQFPGQEWLQDTVSDPLGALGFADALFPAGKEYTDEMREVLSRAQCGLYYDDEPVELGEMIPNGAVIRDEETGETLSILVPGDTNSDGTIDVRDAYAIEDSGASRSGSDMFFKASDFNGDGEADRTDVLYLLNYLTDGSINSRARVAALATAPAGERTATVSLANLTQGYENVRGVQVDLLDPTAAGMTDVAGSNNVAATEGAADFARTVYNEGGDYVRTIAASFDGHLDTANGQITVTYNADADEVMVPVLVYVVTDDGVEMVDRTLTLSDTSEQPGTDDPDNPGGEDPSDPDTPVNPDDPAGVIEQEKENLSSALDAFEDTIANSNLSDEKKEELAQAAQEIRDQLEGATDAETVDALQDQLGKLQDQFQQEVDKAEDNDSDDIVTDGDKGNGSDSDSGDKGTGSDDEIPVTGDYALFAAGGLAAASAVFVGVGVYLRRRKSAR